MAKCPFICGNLFTFASKIQIRKKNEKKYCALPADGRNDCLRFVSEI